MKIASFVSILFLASALALFSSCENSDQTTLSSAQACLDQANSATTASACVTQLGSLRTPEAYLIICSAHFIAQGFTTARFASAYNALTGSASGTNSTAQSMSFMAFSATTGAHGSVQTLSDCQASNVKSLTRLAVLSQMATLVGSVAAGLGSTYDPNTGYTPAQITTALAAFGTSGGDAATLGSTAVTASAVYCAAGSSFQTSSVCTTLGAALAAGTTPTAIGTALITQLQITH